MDWDDVQRKPAKAIAAGENLETLSLAELEIRIQGLEEEIKRTRAEIEKKRAHEVAASKLFKS